MALPWQWILDKLARQPEVGVDALREFAGYIPNAARQRPLQIVLAHRQLHELLTSDEPLDSHTIADLVGALASSNEDIDKLLEMAGEPNSRETKAELFRYVQRKKASLETPVLDKIARDYTAGVYPPAERLSTPANEAEKNSSHKNHSVGSEATTVIIPGNENHKDDKENAASSGRKDVVLLDARNEDTFFKNCKRICRGIGTKLFKQKDDQKTRAPEDDEKQVEEDNEHEEDEEEPVINTSRRRKSTRALLSESSDEDTKAGEIKEAEARTVEPVQEKKHGEMCFKCNRRGELLCCEGCQVAVHIKCVGLRSVPENEWICPGCVYKRALEKVAIAEEEARRAKLEMERTLGPFAETELKLNSEKEESKPETSSEEGSPTSEESSSSEKSTESWRPKRKPTGREMIPHVRRRKIKWSKVEEETLREGVKKYQSQWAKILMFGMGKFHPSRTGVDLKDKWRNLKKKA